MLSIDVPDFAGIGALFKWLGPQDYRAVIHGKPSSRMTYRRRSVRANRDDPATIVARPTRIKFIDCDKVKLLPGLTASDLGGCARYLRSLMPPELHRTSMWVQATSSRGLPGKENIASMRLIVRLSRALSDDEMKWWFKDSPFDCCVFAAAQPIYTAWPKFVGISHILLSVSG